MKALTFLGVLVLSVEAISASTFIREDKQKKITFSVANEWQNLSKKDYCNSDSCTCIDPDQETKENVQEYYDGTRLVTWRFHGEAYVIADNVMKSFEDFLKKLFFFTGTNSTVLPSNSNAMLVTMGKCKDLNRSPKNIIFQFKMVLPEVVVDFKNVVDNLTPHLSDLTCSVKEALDELGGVFKQVMDDIVFSYDFSGCKKKVDYEPVFEKLQKLMNTVAFIAEIVLKNDCETKPEVQEAVTVLSTQFWYFTIAVQGIYSCFMDMLSESRCPVVEKTKSVSMSFNYALVTFTETILAIVHPISKTIAKFLTIFVNITAALNTLVKNVLGLFSGLTIDVADITQNIIKNVKFTSPSTGRTNIVRGFSLS